MNMKEMLKQKKQALVDLEPMLSAEDVSEETIVKGEELVKEIGELEVKIANAEKASKVLESLGSTEEKTNDMGEQKMSQMEDFTKKCAEITDKKAGAKVHFEKSNTTVVTAPQIADVDRSIAPVGGRTPASSLFSEAQISGNAITYFLEGDFETPDGGIVPTAQGAKKPQVSTSFTPTTLALSKIAAYVKETDEILADAPFLASEVQNTLMHNLGKTEDAYVINAIGSTVGIGAETYDGTTVTFADGILASIMKVKNDSAYDASVVILNPADIVTLMTAKDSNNQYYGGGYFVGAYGNGSFGVASAIWGVPIYASSAVAQGSALVCAKEAVKTWRKGGMDVSIAEENEDDFLYNRVTLRAEVRLATAVVDLKGVVLLAESGS